MAFGRSGPPPRVDKVVTSGTFSIDGEDFAVDNNIWIIGDDEECIVIDAAHAHEPIVEQVEGLRIPFHVRAIGHFGSSHRVTQHAPRA